MPFVGDHDVVIERFGRRMWRLVEPLVYEGEDQMFTIPARYATDFASVPRALQWLVPTYGPYTRAAILHDWLITDEPNVSSRDKDGLFRRVMREEGTHFVLRWVMWAAVRAAAAFNRKRGQVGRDWFAILGIGLLAAPFILPGVLGVLVSLGLTWPFRKADPSDPA